MNTTVPAISDVTWTIFPLTYASSVDSWYCGAIAQDKPHEAPIANKGASTIVVQHRDRRDRMLHPRPATMGALERNDTVRACCKGESLLPIVALL